MKIIILFLFLFSFVYGDCPSSTWTSTTKCKISVDDVNITEGNSGTKTLTFTISSDDTVGKDIKIDFQTKDNTATTDDNDYDEGSNTATIKDGDDSTTVSITINGDTKYEDNETFDFNITINSDSTDDAELEDDGVGIGGITNDDDKPTVSWKSDNKTVDETDDNFNTTMTLQLDTKSGVDTNVTLKFTDGTAKKKSDDTDDEKNDYDTPQKSVVIPAGSTEADVNITIIGETKKDSQKVEDFNITIDSADNADVDSNDTRTISINDDESIDTVYVVSKTVSESDGDITVSLKINGGATQAIDVDWALDDDSADTDDYTDNSGTVHFDVGDTEKTITVNIKDDDIAEDEEKFKVNLTQDDTSDTHYVDGYVTIKESDKLIIVGSIYDSPEAREDQSPMKIYVRLKDPNEKAKNDIKINIQTSEDTATDGDDYNDIDKDLTIKAGDNNISTDVTIIDDDESEENEDFNIKLTCKDCGNVDINESEDTGSIIDNDVEDTLNTGEYNDTDNYYLRDGSGDKKYKRLFCTPLNVWDNDGKVRTETDEANITQILIGEDYNISYHRLYAKNIVDDNGDPSTDAICKGGTKICETESLSRLGDSMDVNETWFDDSKVDHVNMDLPDCSDNKATIYNVDENGKQIYYNGGEYGDCEVSFKIRDKNYSKPFLFKSNFKFYGGKTKLIMDGGSYFFQKIKADGKVILTINEDENNPHNIARLYFQDSDHGYIFASDSIINYEDCNGDGDIDTDDIPCQKPSKLMYWISADADMNDVLQDGLYMSAFIYNAVGDRGDGASDASFTFDTDNPHVQAFVGALSGYRIDIDPNADTKVYWMKPDPDMKFFLGDGNKCIYTPSTYIKSENQKFYESQEDDADINISVEYFTPGTRQALCENDWKIKFDWEIKEHGDGEGNATQGADYEADNYTGTMEFAKQCDSCNKEKCWPALSKTVDFSVKYDNIEEPDEVFDFNLSNPKNTKFEDTDDNSFLYLMTIIDVAPPQTITGLFDAYDLFRADKENDNSGKVGDDSDEDRNISVKISGKKFGLTLGVFDPAYSDTLKKTDDDVTVKYKVVYCPEENTTDASDCKDLSNTLYESAEEQLQMFYTNKYTEQDINITTDDSHQNVAVRFTVCSLEKDDGTVELYPYYNSECLSHGGVCKDKDGNNQKCYRDVLSTDKFTIRPDKLKLEMNKVKDLISAQGYELNITALQYDSDDKVDDNYTVTNADKNYTIVQNIYKSPTDDSIDNTLNGTVTFPESFDMTDGNVTTKITFDDVGKVHIQIIDKIWAKIDEDVSPADCSEDGTWVCGEINATFIPDHFNVTNNEVKNNGGEVYTYITDDINNTSATLSLKITAENKDGNTTKNFKDDHWENDINVTFSIVDNSATTDINESNNTKNELIEANLDFNDGEATIEHNNTVLSFNYERNNSKAINPFQVEGSDISTTVKSGYDTVTVVGNSSMNDNATFIYPKAYAPKYRYTGNTGDAYIYVLDYCYDNGCNKNLLPDGSSSKTIDDPRWFINTKHKAKYGKVNEVKEKKKSNVTVTSLNDEDPKTKASLELDSSIKKVYKTTMEINASKWLIYNKYDEDKKYNEFNVEFYNGSTGWAGEHNTDTTTKKSGSSTSHSRLIW